MKESRRLELQAMLDDARASGDAARIEAVRYTIDRENLECTAHTAERLKLVEADVREIKTTVHEVRDDIRAFHHKAEGAKLLWDALKLLAGAGGGAAILKLLGAG